jgi:hypothetical protein
MIALTARLNERDEQIMTLQVRPAVVWGCVVREAAVWRGLCGCVSAVGGPGG